MLIDFRLTNYRSFRDETVLRLTATADKSYEDSNILKTGNKSVPRLLRSVGVYGANAGGKSNLIRAMQLMRGIVNDSAGLQEGQLLNVQPFLLDSDTAGQPVQFEITFLLDDVRYQFGFSLNPNRILSEWLVVYKSTQPATWYERTYRSDLGTYDYKFSAQFAGQKSLWQSATRENALFLSVAVQLNSAQLRPVFNYITRRLVVFENGSAPAMDYTVAHIAAESSKHICTFLSDADISIADIHLVKREAVFGGMSIDLAKREFQPQEIETKEIAVPTFEHRSRKGTATFELQDESEGTQKLFALSAPIFDILKNGRMLIVDEIDRSLHALLVKNLIGMFHDPDLNRNGAQLVFTTHDTSLMEGDLLRRDQIWFTEKDEDQATHLFPLTDISPRKHEAFERGYLSGRYGGVPILRNIRFL